MAAIEEPHCWSTNLAAKLSGKFAKKIGNLPPYSHCSPTAVAQPTMKSSNSSGLIPFLLVSSGINLANSSSDLYRQNTSLAGSLGRERDCAVLKYPVITTSLILYPPVVASFNSINLDQSSNTGLFVSTVRPSASIRRAANP